MPYQKITSTPVDLGAEHTLSAGTVYDLQAVSGKSALYYIAAEDAPTNGARGLRLGFDEEPYPAEIPADPVKLWVWTESGNDGDLYFEVSSAGLGGGGGGSSSSSSSSTGTGTDLPDLGTGQSWVGPSTTPTDIATQGDLDTHEESRHITSAQKTKLDGLAEVKTIGERLTLSSAGELLADEQLWFGSDSGTPEGNLSGFRIPISKEADRGSARVDELLNKVGTGASVELSAGSRELVDTTYASWWGANDLLSMALDDDGNIHVLSRDESNKIFAHTSETSSVHLTGSGSNPAEADYFAVGEEAYYLLQGTALTVYEKEYGVQGRIQYDMEASPGVLSKDFPLAAMENAYIGLAAYDGNLYLFERDNSDDLKVKISEIDAGVSYSYDASNKLVDLGGSGSATAGELALPFAGDYSINANLTISEVILVTDRFTIRRIGTANFHSWLTSAEGTGKSVYVVFDDTGEILEFLDSSAQSSESSLIWQPATGQQYRAIAQGDMVRVIIADSGGLDISATLTDLQSAFVSYALPHTDHPSGSAVAATITDSLCYTLWTYGEVRAWDVSSAHVFSRRSGDDFIFSQKIGEDASIGLHETNLYILNDNYVHNWKTPQATGGQASTGEETAVATLTPSITQIVLYAYPWPVTTPDATADPTAVWRFDDGWEGDAPFHGGIWRESKADALDAADNNPAFVEADSVSLIARQQVLRYINSLGEYAYRDYGWTKEAEFGLQFSTDKSSWHTVQATADEWARNRGPDGTYGPAFRIKDQAAPAGPEWVTVSVNSIYGTANDGSTVRDYDIPSEYIDFSRFSQLRYSLIPFVEFSSPRKWGIAHQTKLDRPVDGWKISSPDISSPPNFDRRDAYTLFYHNEYGLHIGRTSETEGDPIAFASNVFGGSGRPAKILSWYFKFYTDDAPDNTPDETNVTNLKVYLFGGVWARANFKIEGLLL